MGVRCECNNSLARAINNFKPGACGLFMGKKVKTNSRKTRRYATIMCAEIVRNLKPAMCVARGYNGVWVGLTLAEDDREHQRPRASVRVEDIPKCTNIYIYAFVYRYSVKDQGRSGSIRNE